MSTGVILVLYIPLIIAKPSLVSPVVVKVVSTIPIAGIVEALLEDAILTLILSLPPISPVEYTGVPAVMSTISSFLTLKWSFSG